MKKVLVSGCFDLLHAGHVEFFREAAQLGQLYVRLGSDANIALLKRHQPLYPEAERLFMARAIRYVHDCEISLGSGEFDFFQDLVEVKPDIYYVNEDCSNLAVRSAKCKELGIEIIVAKRIAPRGLEPRSSTSLKRLKSERDVLEAEAPWRLCLAGGWMDLDWCNVFHAGSVITVNIKYNEGISRNQCGLATSSRQHFIQLWGDKSNLARMDNSERAALYLWGAENADHFALKTKPYVAGAQDHIGLLFPGINKLDFAPNTLWPHRIQRAPSADLALWLESVLYIVDIPLVARPGGAAYDSQRVNNLTDSAVPHERKVEMVRALAQASQLAWEGICAKDCTMLGRALSATMAAWEAMLPYTVDPYLGEDDTREQSNALRAFWKQYDHPHCKGCLFTGAGGGYLMVIDDKPVTGGMRIQVNHDAFTL